MSEPIAFTVTRFKCPHCSRGRSKRVAAIAHMARCWRNPDVRGCLTCRHFEPHDDDAQEWCTAGVSLDGKPPCVHCDQLGAVGLGRGVPCPTCGGIDPEGVQPGPFVGCEKWEAKP